jgi:hypothetical protein
MAIKMVCDKCGNIYEDYSEGGDDSVTKEPDYLASIEGVVISRYNDLCETCVKRICDNTEKYINVSTRVRVKKGK